jgi:flavin reductase (DIM6/NTAB) family NADH-FMN oxidoreductase RutF
MARSFADGKQDHETASRLGVHYTFTERGTPWLESCLAQLACRLVRAHQAGDHTIFVGEVEQAAIHKGRPLLFYGARYRRLKAASR